MAKLPLLDNALSDGRPFNALGKQQYLEVLWGYETRPELLDNHGGIIGQRPMGKVADASK